MEITYKCGEIADTEGVKPKGRRADMTKQRPFFFMKRVKKSPRIIAQPTSAVDELWLEKARKLQARRWHKLEQDVKDEAYDYDVR